MPETNMNYRGFIIINRRGFIIILDGQDLFDIAICSSIEEAKDLINKILD